MRQNRMLEEKTKQRQHTWDHTMGAWWHKHEMAWKRAKEKWLRSFVLFVVPFVCDNVTTSMVPSVGNLVLVFVAKCRICLVGCLFVCWEIKCVCARSLVFQGSRSVLDCVRVSAGFWLSIFTHECRFSLCIGLVLDRRTANVAHCTVFRFLSVLIQVPVIRSGLWLDNHFGIAHWQLHGVFCF